MGGASQHPMQNRWRDGSLYQRAEWERLVSDFLSIKDVHICGKKTELILIPAGRVKDLLVRSVPWL